MKRKPIKRRRPAAKKTAPPLVAPPFIVDQRMLDVMGVHANATPPRQPWQLPELPKGVRPARIDANSTKLAADESPFVANDDGSSLFAYGNSLQNAMGLGVTFPGYPYLAELAQISEYRSPAETIATEMTRKWLQFKSTGQGDKSAKIKKITQWFEDHKVRELFRTASLQDGLFGRSQIYINMQGVNDDTRQLPLTIDPKTIQKNSVQSLKIIEPYWLSPFSYNATDPTRADFYKPQSYFVMAKKTHSSRFLIFVSRPVSDLLKPTYNFGGVSLTQLIQPYVQRWLKTVNSVGNALTAFSTSVLATAMGATLAPGGSSAGAGTGFSASPGQNLVNRVALFNAFRDVRGCMVIDKSTEEFLEVSKPLSGLHELQAQAQEHMAAPTHIPLVKLTGITPSGLNANSDGEIQVFYDWIIACQENLFGDHINTLTDLAQLDLFGDIDDEIRHEWMPLDELDGTQLAQNRKSDAEAGVAYINAGVVAPAEERERLQTDPNSGYANLTGGPPDPPQDPNQIDPQTGQPFASLPDDDNDKKPDDAAS